MEVLVVQGLAERVADLVAPEQEWEAELPAEGLRVLQPRGRLQRLPRRLNHNNRQHPSPELWASVPRRKERAFWFTKSRSSTATGNFLLSCSSEMSLEPEEVVVLPRRVALEVPPQAVAEVPDLLQAEPAADRSPVEKSGEGRERF